MKQKYSSLREQIDEMLIKKNEELRSPSKRERGDLKTENEFL